MSDNDKVDNLNQALNRLMMENSQLRKKLEEVEVYIRQKAVDADGLTLLGSLKAIIAKQIKTEDRVEYFRDEIRSILKYLLTSEEKDSKIVNELRKRINHFLFKNPR